jgi:hypothetical protein
MPMTDRLIVDVDQAGRSWKRVLFVTCSIMIVIGT